MTNDMPELPRYSRDVAVLSGRLPDSDDDADVAGPRVLDPFSGVLDVTFGRGRVPMLDLSYLSLESLVASDLARSTGGMSSSRTSPTATADPKRGSSEGDAGEPTVREVIRGDRDARPERDVPDLQRLALEDEGPPRTRVALGSQERTEQTDRTDVTGNPDREAPNTTRDPDLSSSVDAETSFSATDRTVVDRSEPSIDQPGRVEGPSTSVEQPDSVDTPSSSIDRSGPTASDDVVPPRMITDRADGDAGATARRPDRRNGVSSAGRESDHPGRTVESPRMVVEETGDESTDESAAGSGDTTAAPSSGSDRVGRDPGESIAGRDEQLAAVIEASADPESRLVDRLYRTLRERESIEQRRRFGR